MPSSTRQQKGIDVILYVVLTSTSVVHMNQNQRSYDPTADALSTMYIILNLCLENKSAGNKTIKDLYSWYVLKDFLLLIEMYMSSLHVMSTVVATTVYNKCVARAKRQMSPLGVGTSTQNERTCKGNKKWEKASNN